MMKKIVKTFLFLVVLIFLCTPAMATLLTPNGNPTGGPTATDGKITSTLDPSPAIFMDDCPWFEKALSVQGFDADGLDNIAGNADDWTVTYGDLSGTLTLKAYYPWVNLRPAFSIGGQNFPAKSFPGQGGATLALTYQPAGDDPSGVDVHWIQVINTNAPIGSQAKYDAGGGYKWYLDNDLDTSNPFYDFSYDTAGDTWFLDGPHRFPKADWEAQIFVATGDLLNNTITIYDGVWWGFEVTAIPEPTTMFLLGSGLVGLVGFRRKFRKK